MSRSPEEVVTVQNLVHQEVAELVALDASPAPGPVEHDVIQGSADWLRLRAGMLTSSNVKHILTPTLKLASNEKSRAHIYEILAFRLTGHVEPGFLGHDMIRGEFEERLARQRYAETFSPVREVGFITNECWGFPLGFSPDGLVGDDGMIEIKSRAPKLQVQTIIEHVAADAIPPEHVLQVQSGLMVSERSWCDFISYSGGLPMTVVRVYRDERVIRAIEEAAAQFHDQLEAAHVALIDALRTARAVATERTEMELMA